eukprot:111880_1
MFHKHHTENIHFQSHWTPKLEDVVSKIKQKNFTNPSSNFSTYQEHIFIVGCGVHEYKALLLPHTNPLRWRQTMSKTINDSLSALRTWIIETERMDHVKYRVIIR